ncbi:ANTAR domain-containing protein [Streptomyces sp. NPDC005526]|uniref:ANTAR domain-containing protein n=1 Tax=Streptomyces sp. NPDC005526 TaxID=3156885 RepID=UPI0033A3FB8C
MASTASPPLMRRTHILVDTLVIDVRREADGRAVLTPRGELVHGCAGILSRALAGVSPGSPRIDLDLARVTYMDTAGLQFLDTLDAYGRRHAVVVTATGWTGQPRRILELAGLDTTDPLNPARRPARPRSTPPVSSVVAAERTEQLLLLRQELDQLREALTTRPVIDQARGILMAAHGCTSRQAWDILREVSQRSNTKLRAVAAMITAGTQPDAPPPPEEIRTALRGAIESCRP